MYDKTCVHLQLNANQRTYAVDMLISSTQKRVKDVGNRIRRATKATLSFLHNRALCTKHTRVNKAPRHCVARALVDTKRKRSSTDVGGVKLGVCLERGGSTEEKQGGKCSFGLFRM